MQLDFLCELFAEYDIERFEDSIVIKKPGFSKPIKVYCDLDEYIVCFATQHRHIDDREELSEVVAEFATAQMAAIEFFADGKARFGGQIETDKLKDLTCAMLCELFGYAAPNITSMTFRVYGWDKACCFEGAFKKTASQEWEIVKKDCPL